MTDREKLLEWCKLYCNNPNLEDIGGFSMVLDELSKSIERTGVTMESLSDMSQAFGDSAEINVGKLLSPYRKFKGI